MLLDAPRRAKKRAAEMTSVIADEHFSAIAKADGHVALVTRDGRVFLRRERDLDVLDGGFVPPERETCSAREGSFFLAAPT